MWVTLRDQFMSLPRARWIRPTLSFTAGCLVVREPDRKPAAAGASLFDRMNRNAKNPATLACSDFVSPIAPPKAIRALRAWRRVRCQAYDQATTKDPDKNNDAHNSMDADICVGGIALPVFAEGPLTEKDCKLKRYASVDMTVIGNDILIPVTIENRPALMVLNTQSAATVMWQPSAREFGLTPRPLPGSAQVFFGKQRITQYASTRSLALGRMRYDAEQILLAAAPET
jgi:hypothetical protein